MVSPCPIRGSCQLPKARGVRAGALGEAEATCIWEDRAVVSGVFRQVNSRNRDLELGYSLAC